MNEGFTFAERIIHCDGPHCENSCPVKIKTRYGTSLKTWKRIGEKRFCSYHCKDAYKREEKKKIPPAPLPLFD